MDSEFAKPPDRGTVLAQYHDASNSLAQTEPGQRFDERPMVAPDNPSAFGEVRRCRVKNRPPFLPVWLPSHKDREKMIFPDLSSA